MTIGLKITDGDGKGTEAIVSETGELLTRPFDYSDVESVVLDSANTSFPLWGPQADSNFIVTAILLSTNKDITVNGTLVQIYEADAPDSIIVTKNRGQMNLLKNAVVPVTPLLARINMGKYLNVKHDDASPNAVVYVSVAGYYVPEVGTTIK